MEQIRDVNNFVTQYETLNVVMSAQPDWLSQHLPESIRVYSIENRKELFSICQQHRGFTLPSWIPIIFGALWNPLTSSGIPSGFAPGGSTEQQKILARSSASLPEEVLNYFTKTFGNDVLKSIAARKHLPVSTQKLLTEIGNWEVLKVFTQNPNVNRDLKILAGLRLV